MYFLKFLQENLVYSTYLGGTNFDSGRGIAVDSSKNVYITGYTYSNDFPTINPVKTYQSNGEAFVTKYGGLILNSSPPGDNGNTPSQDGSGAVVGQGVASPNTASTPVCKAVSSTDKSAVDMQNTGMPLAPLGLAILSLLGGLAATSRKIKSQFK
jgi:hypothetical protein